MNEAELKDKSTQYLGKLACALACARSNNLMAHEHAAAVWKKALRESGFDIPKKNNLADNEESTIGLKEVLKDEK